MRKGGGSFFHNKKRWKRYKRIEIDAVPYNTRPRVSIAVVVEGGGVVVLG